MHIPREWLLELIYGGETSRRFTQDSPVLPDVWLEFGEAHAAGPQATLDLLLTPHRDASVGELFRAVRARLERDRKRTRRRLARGSHAMPSFLACNQTAVVARLTLGELVRVVLPLSQWGWQVRPETSAGGRTGRHADGEPEPAARIWLARVVSALLLAQKRAVGGVPGAATARPRFDAEVGDHARCVAALDALARDVESPSPAESGSLYLVSLNRRATVSIARSVLAVKADAARRLFNVSCAGLAWAVVDSGVDARHPAFRVRDAQGWPYPHPFGPAGDPANHTRVVATYDFTLLRPLLTPEGDHAAARRAHAGLRRAKDGARRAVSRRLEDELRYIASAVERVHDPERRARDLRLALEHGRTVDWDALRPLLEVPPLRYRPPPHEHGTHVAGILAADWQNRHWTALPNQAPPGDDDLVGVCPDLRLYDLRCLDEAGCGDEFTVMAALQFVRHLNADRENPLIHGVNLSLSIRHDVANYACGRTPVCDECERVVGSGAVVVVAAGNLGYEQYATPVAGGAALSTLEGYRSISITDPGNADSVITVGATHRYQPHTYGVSYFSSRGPTGDGRAKPDLVAPGEKILSPVPDGDAKVMDGTSMAAPHVSGAAAMLMARHRELVGRPQRVKEVLCGTATDLGRERYFQGAGMLDILRALQSI